MALRVRRSALIVIPLVTALAACGSCNPYEQIARDKQRFPPLSASRTPGSPCSQEDSASVTRARRHPLWPTGGWDATAEVDYRRTLGRALPEGARALLVGVGSVFAGYVRFDTEGSLRVRTYDDVYGAVYGGWSPVQLELKPTRQPVFVALGRSAYGDGGLDQVHEVCWTPKYATSDGVIVFSTAHAPRAPGLRAREYFRKTDLGHRGQTFHDRLAVQLLVELLQDRELEAARALLRDARALLEALPGAVDGATGAAIPPRIFWGRQWADLLAFELGVAVATPHFDAVAEALEQLLAARSSGPFCYGCDRYERMLPFYRWVDARARGQSAPPPQPSSSTRGDFGHDPLAIARLLADGRSMGRGAPTAQFWAGVRALHEGDAARAKAELSAFLAGSPPPVTSGFELGAAARLLEQLEGR